MKRIFFTLTLVLFVIPFGISQDLPSYVPTDGLVVYYPFNGNANDESGNGHHGTVNEVNNTVSYTFNEAVSFKAVTASAADATLTIEDVYPLDAGIFVYPNPTANRIYIQGENILQAELFDLTGRKIITTNQKQIDLGNIPTGSYILQVTAQNNKTQSFKIIKQ